MKKQLLLVAAMLVATFAAKAECQDGPYKLVVNGSQVADFVDGGMSPDNLPQLNVQYSIKSGDVVEFENASCGEKFFPQTIETGGDVDGSSFFTVGATSATCSQDGCYNFWWKKVYGADKLYIGTDGQCSDNGGNQGGGQGGNDGGNQGGGQGSADGCEGTWYYKGWNGTKDMEPSDETAFTAGVATFNAPADSYIMLIYQIHGQQGAQYMTTTPGQSSESPAIMKQWDGGDKMHVPAGNHTLYLYDNGDDTYTLSLTQLSGKTLACANGGNDGGNQGGNDGGNQGGNDGGNQGGNDGGNQGGNGGLTVRLQKPADWAEVYIYAWGEGTPDLLGAWPGAPATEIGEGWFGHTFSESTINVVFNNNQDPITQTVDITGITASTCYTLADPDAEGKYNVSVSADCPAIQQSDALEEVTISLDINAPMFNVLGQPVDNTYHGIVIQNGHKFLLK